MTLQVPNVLLLSTSEAEVDNLKEILSRHAILRCAENVGELEGLLETRNYDALFCCKSFQVNGALGGVRQRYPDLPVIIASRTGGEQEWIEALSAGAFDLLAQPYEERSVLYILEHALVSRVRGGWQYCATPTGNSKEKGRKHEPRVFSS